jgi:protease PrsW
MAPSEPKAVLDARRFGRTPVVFIAGLGTCSLIALVALLAAVRGGPVPALAGLALALLPVLLVLAGILVLDRFDPEPGTSCTAARSRRLSWVRTRAGWPA